MRYPITVTKLLQVLPPFRDEWITVKKKQDVSDIIKEVLKDHDEFKDHYDLIGNYFNGNNVNEIADNIYFFLKKNIRYVEEHEDDQTTSIPAGILTRGHCDCKGYAMLSGGILDALKRRGKKIDWFYRFGSYDFRNDAPHHVFIVINDRGREITIDPTPGSERKVPVWILDKHIKPYSMALRKNIAGIGQSDSDTINGINVFDLASSLFSSIFGNIVIGDQVPEYPIKSKVTLKGILDATMPEFPDPKSVSDAVRLYDKAMYFISVADDKIKQKALEGKSTAVDETYKMIYQEIATTYQNYIEKYSNQNNPADYPDQDNPYIPPDPPAPGPGNDNPPTQDTKKMNPLTMAALAGGGLLLISQMGKPQGPARRRKVSGIPKGLFLALAVGGGVYLLTRKKGPTTQQKREDLIDFAGDAGDSNAEQIFIDMTDDEINTVYQAIFVETARPLPEGPLRTRFQMISDKYDIFT